MAPNEKAIRKWIEKNRPDLSPQLDSLMKSDAGFAMMAMGFEAGRDFQRANPAAGPFALTEPIESYEFNY